MIVRHSQIAWVLLAALGRALVCPVAKCEGLRENLCALVDDGKLEINYTPCDVGYVCTVADVLQWWAAHSGSGEFECTPYPAVLRNSTMSTQCGVKLEKHEFQKGGGHIDCESDTDCILDDGSVIPGSCQCSLRMNGRGICVPDTSNKIYSRYWDDCDSDGQLREDSIAYWSFYSSLWAILQSDVPCTSHLAEIDTFTNLYLEYQDAYAHVVFLLVGAINAASGSLVCSYLGGARPHCILYYCAGPKPLSIETTCNKRPA